MKSIKNNKAITLIALIITIIILLILAGVAISFTIGENGIFDKSKQSAEKYKYQSSKEKLAIKLSDITMDVLQESNRTAGLDDLIKINEQDSNMKVDTIEDEDGYEIVKVEDYYDEENSEADTIKVATVKVDEYVFLVDDKYNIIEGNFESQEKEPEVVPEGYTPIYTADDLKAIKNDLKAKYILMRNINLAGVQFEPIGNNKDNKFQGVFEGNSKIIRNLTIDRSTEDNIGLFGYSSGEIKNVKLEKINITGKSAVGGLVGYNTGHIEQIILKEINITGNDCIGGLVGSNIGEIKGINIQGNIQGKSSVGGLFGASKGVTNVRSIENIVLNVTVDGTGTYIGGAIGYFGDSGETSLKNVVSLANVSSSNNNCSKVGGLIRSYIHKISKCRLSN